MKKIGESILILIACLHLPIIIEFGFKDSYNSNRIKIWIASTVLAILLSFAQIDFKINPGVNKFFRTLQFYLFQTKTIALILICQLSVVLLQFFINYPDVNLKIVLLSFGINLIAFNILLLIDKISNTDSKELVLHVAKTGKIYLYSKNRLRYVPDPPVSTPKSQTV